MAMDPNVVEVEVTRPSRDGGRDAVGQYAIGPSFDRVRLQFALEAKCYAATNGVGVREVARLVSRIKHREFGVLVTTSYVATQAYSEIRQDGHLVIFVTGRDIVNVLKRWGIHTAEGLRAMLATEHPVSSEAVRVDVVTSAPAVSTVIEHHPDHERERHVSERG